MSVQADIGVTADDLGDRGAALDAISNAAKASLTALIAPLDVTDPAALRAGLIDDWPELVAYYGEMTATLAFDVLSADLEALGLAGDPLIVDAVDRIRAVARLRWAVGVADPPGTLAVLLDELVKQPYRSSVAKTAAKHAIGWARVPQGDTCAFCLMLASKGAFYSSAASAGAYRKYHGDCNCIPTLITEESGYPDGYDPDALYDLYRAAADATDKPGTKAVLATLRKQQGSH